MDIDPEELRSGAMPGMDAEEQAENSVGYGDGIPRRRAARLAEQILSEPMVGSEQPTTVSVAESRRNRSKNRHLDGYGRRGGLL